MEKFYTEGPIQVAVPVNAEISEELPVAVPVAVAVYAENNDKSNDKDESLSLGHLAVNAFITFSVRRLKELSTDINLQLDIQREIIYHLFNAQQPVNEEQEVLALEIINKILMPITVPLFIYNAIINAIITVITIAITLCLEKVFSLNNFEKPPSADVSLTNLGNEDDAKRFSL